MRHCADRWRVVLDTSCLRHLWRVNEGAGRSAAWCVGRVHACGGLGEKISPQNSLCSLRDAFESMRTAGTIWNPFFHTVPISARCEFKKGQIAPLFTPKMALPWSLAAPPTTLYLRGNLEFAIPELRAKADLCIKARALDAPTLRTRAPRHSPTITRRPNPCAVAVAGSKHHISIFPGGAHCEN